MTTPINYPDILGAITQGARANFGVAQAALTVRPAQPRAGRPFDVLLVVQNASDTDIEITAALMLPDVDARRQKGRFAARSPRVTAHVKPAEVGYVVLPVLVAPDAAPARSYHLGVEVDAKPLGKPQRLRSDHGGGLVEQQFVPPALRERITQLAGLSYSTQRRGAHTLDVMFDLAPGKPGETVKESQPGWVSVCKVSDYRDDRLLLHRYGALLQVKTLPHLKRAELYEPLKQTVGLRFADAGYALHPAESGLIAKLLTLVLEYASPRHTGHGHVAAGRYNVDALFARDPFTLDSEPYIPHWMRAVISMVERDARAAEHPLAVFTKYSFDDVLRDGIDYAFDLVERDSGEDVGSDEERANYRERVLERLRTKAGIDFSVAYLPLIMGGMIVSDQVMLPKESPSELLKEVSHALERRADEVEPDDPIYSMTQDILWRTGQKYGIKLS